MNIFHASNKSLTKWIVIYALMGLTLFLVSCAGPHMITKSNKPEFEAKSGKALLVIVRTMSIFGSVPVENYLDGKLIGITRGKSYFITDVNPGKHYLMARADNMVTTRVDFEPEKIYFLQQSIIPGGIFTMTAFYVFTYEEAMKQMNESGSRFLVYDPGDSDTYLSEKDFKEAKEEFDQEVSEENERHKEILEYRGYNKTR